MKALRTLKLVVLDLPRMTTNKKRIFFTLITAFKIFASNNKIATVHKYEKLGKISCLFVIFLENKKKLIDAIGVSHSYRINHGEYYDTNNLRHIRCIQR